MNEQELEALRYPRGRFQRPQEVSVADLEKWTGIIEALPQQLRATLSGWTDAQLDTPYRPEGWTVRQVTHHLADSHLNAYTRIRLALTEDVPTIKPYEEKHWAELPDAKEAPVEWSLQLLEATHARWVMLLRRLEEEQWLREFLHPDLTRPLRVDTVLALYAWHSLHHLSHIQSLQQRMGW